MRADVLEHALAVLQRSSPDILQLTEAWVSVNSHSRNVPGVDHVGSLIRESLRTLPLAVRVEPGTPWGNHLSFSTPAAEQLPAILLIGHHDTVFPPGTLRRLSPRRVARLRPRRAGYEGWTRNGQRGAQGTARDRCARSDALAVHQRGRRGGGLTDFTRASGRAGTAGALCPGVRGRTYGRPDRDLAAGQRFCTGALDRTRGPRRDVARRGQKRHLGARSLRGSRAERQR